MHCHADQGYQPNPPEVDFEEEFGVERVTILVNWTQPENPLVSYNIRVDPTSGTMVTIVDSTRANLTLSYNTPYNVTVVADFCGQRNATAQFELSYGNRIAHFQTSSIIICCMLFPTRGLCVMMIVHM